MKNIEVLSASDSIKIYSDGEEVMSNIKSISFDPVFDECPKISIDALNKDITLHCEYIETKQEFVEINGIKYKVHRRH